MQFGSRIKRNFWTTVVLGLVPDSLIGAAVAYVTGAGLVGIFLYGFWTAVPVFGFISQGPYLGLVPLLDQGS